MKVEYIDHMGTDLSVVNAARVSFDKKSDAVDWTGAKVPNGTVPVPILRDADVKLIQYLAAHNHWSPFAHAFVSLRWKAPIFVARQLVKHQVGLAWNEVSRRYVKTEPELWFPDVYRESAENVKQGSSQRQYIDDNGQVQFLEQEALRMSVAYSQVVARGMCPEQARMFLPQNTYTTWVWSGSLYAFARVYNQRTEPTAQQETRQLVLTLDEICGKLFPVSWGALTKKGGE